MKKKISFTFMWMAMAAIMVMFSTITYNELSGKSSAKAYAATISEDSQLQHAKTVAAIKNADEDFGDSGRHGGSHHGGHGHQTMCALSDDVLAILKAKFDATVFTMNADGAVVTVVQLDQSQLTRDKVKLLRETLRGSHCQGVHVGNSLFYILFRGDVS